MVRRPQPKFALSEYRKFIRDASPYVSIVVGRQIRPQDADGLTDEEVREIAFLIDQRADELKKRGFDGGNSQGEDR